METGKKYIKKVKNQYDTTRNIITLVVSLIREIKLLFGSEDSYIVYNILFVFGMFFFTIMILGFINFFLQFINLIYLFANLGISNIFWLTITLSLGIYIIKVKLRNSYTIIFKDYKVIDNYIKEKNDIKHTINSDQVQLITDINDNLDNDLENNNSFIDYDYFINKN
jgi:hypothetical protein